MGDWLGAAGAALGLGMLVGGAFDVATGGQLGAMTQDALGERGMRVLRGAAFAIGVAAIIADAALLLGASDFALAEAGAFLRNGRRGGYVRLGGVPRETFTPDWGGPSIEVPKGWVGSVTRNKRGWYFQPAEDLGSNRNMIRYSRPDAQYPNGSVRYYNRQGQPVDRWGKPGDGGSTHFEPTDPWPIDWPYL